MWVFTEYGFFSIVAHRDKPNTLIVRGRVRDDLVEFHKRAGIRGSKVFENHRADYPYRLELPSVAVGKVLMDSVGAMRYPNFKNQVALKQGHERSNTYHDIWAILAADLNGC